MSSSTVPPRPPSISPHVVVHTSPEVTALLKSHSLPPLHVILQSFSPVPQVTTRSVNLTPIPHNAFLLRFSDLTETEAICAEDEESRAGRILDWISSRVAARAGEWVAHAQSEQGRHAKETKWWSELRQCIEGDVTPTRNEGWNHPAACKLALVHLTVIRRLGLAGSAQCLWQNPLMSCNSDLH